MDLLVITGPTGVGKTELSIKIAEKFNGEIISADSMQIYKNFDVGTAKVDLSTTTIPHHMIDIVEANDDFTVFNFQQKAKYLISDINLRGKLPILVGGTGLYIDSILYNLTFQNSGKNQEYRQYLNELKEKHGIQYLYELLLQKDPNAAKNIDRNNVHRIIRALEISQTGTKDDSKFRDENNEYNLLYLGLTMDRERLYNNINFRVEEMLKKGLLDEVSNLLKQYPSESKAFKAIGYKEVISFLNNEINFLEMKNLIQKNSRHYAKRQLTWFKRDSRIIWLNREDKNILEDIYSLVGEKFE